MFVVVCTKVFKIYYLEVGTVILFVQQSYNSRSLKILPDIRGPHKKHTGIRTNSFPIMTFLFYYYNYIKCFDRYAYHYKMSITYFYNYTYKRILRILHKHFLKSIVLSAIPRILGNTYVYIIPHCSWPNLRRGYKCEGGFIFT